MYLNDVYVGVYLLTEDIRIDPARLDIKKMSSSATVNDLDGGYIVEVDVRLDCFNDGVINLQHRTPKGLSVCEDTPDEGSITQNQLAYIMRVGLSQTKNGLPSALALSMNFKARSRISSSTVSIRFG